MAFKCIKIWIKHAISISKYNYYKIFLKQSISALHVRDEHNWTAEPTFPEEARLAKPAVYVALAPGWHQVSSLYNSDLLGGWQSCSRREGGWCLLCA